MRNSNSAAQLPNNHTFQFTGQAGEYFRIWIVNVALSIFTLGIYSAWAKVRTNQYFYSHTQVAGASFQYLASPTAILKGRLIAFFIFVFYTIASNISAVLSLVLSILFLLVLPWLVTKAWCFRLRNTAYRNIRFNFHPAYNDAYMIFFLFPLLVFVTFGLIIPYMVFRQKRFFVANSAFGKERFQFYGRAGEFYVIFIVAFVLLVIGGTLISVISLIPLIGQVLMILLVLCLYSYVAAYLSCRLNNYIYNSSTLIINRFKSDLDIWQVFYLYITNMIAILVSFGLLIPWVKIRMARYRAEHMTLIAKTDMNRFVAAQHPMVGATGEEISEMFDLDLGL